MEDDMRIDLYGVVHKAQRFHLFQFGETLAHADLGDEADRSRLAEGIRRIVEMLHQHAEHESKYIHPLFARLGSVADGLDGEHEAIDQRLRELADLVANARWSELYSAYMRFLAQYLLHIDEEEREQVRVLWPAYSDAELVAVMRRFKNEQAPEDARRDFGRMLEGLSIPELVSILRRMQDSAPVPDFEAAVHQAEETLDPRRWSQLRDQLGLAPSSTSTPAPRRDEVAA